MNVDKVRQIIASSINFVAEQVTKDLAALICHQHGARYLHDNEYNCEDETIRDDLEPLVWKWHIFNPNGVAAQLDPIEKFINGQEFTTNETVQQVLENAPNFENATIDEITTVNCEHITQDYLRETYKGESDVHVAVFEDGFVQCNCEYCDSFFQPFEIPPNGNRIQEILADYFNSK